MMTARKDTIRIHEMIASAYYELVLEHGTKKITVREILERAGISRGTFYAHFDNTNELDQYVVKRITDRFSDTFANLDPNMTPEELYTVADRFLEFPERYRKQMRIGLSEELGPLFLKRWTESLREGFLQDFPEGTKPTEYQRIILTAVSCSLTGICTQWLLSEAPVSRRDVCELIVRVLKGAVKDIYSEV